MLDKFNKFYNMILEDINSAKSIKSTESTESTGSTEDIKPTCCYCRKPVSMEIYEKQKKYRETEDIISNIPFKPNDCICDKCADSLTKMYSGGTKWTGD